MAVRGGGICCLGQLDWAGKVATLRNAMKYSFRILIFPALIWCALPGPAAGSVIFKPGEKAKYVAPGEEEMGGNAQELFSKAQEAEKNGDLRGAIKAYRRWCERHPKDTSPRLTLSDGAIAGAKARLSQGPQSFDVRRKNSRKASTSTESICSPLSDR